MIVGSDDIIILMIFARFANFYAPFSHGRKDEKRREETQDLGASSVENSHGNVVEIYVI